MTATHVWRIAAAAVTVAVSLCIADVARAETIARTGKVFDQRVSAHGGVVAFSARRFRGRYVLMLYENGRSRRVPVRSQRRPFDVDLGPGAAGRTVAVYSRCRRGGDCDVYRFDLRTRRERLVASISSEEHSEVHPSIWRSRIAFARLRDDLSEPRLLVHRRAAKGSRRLRGGSPNDPEQDAGPPIVESVELRGAKVAFVWSFLPNGCSGLDDNPFAVSQEVIVRRLDGRGNGVIQEGCTGDAATRFPNVALDWRHAYFAYANETTPEVPGFDPRVRRVNLRTGARADSAEELYAYLAVDASDIYLAELRTIDRARPMFAAIP